MLQALALCGLQNCPSQYRPPRDRLCTQRTRLPERSPMSAGRPRSEARDIAVMLGDKFYEGSQCPTCGTTVRYVTGSRCVMCAREVAAKRATARRKPKLATPKQRRIVG